MSSGKIKRREILTRVVIFDLNGIFIQSKKLSDRFKLKFGVPTNKFLPVLKKILAQTRRPNAGDAWPYWQPHLKKLGLKLTKNEFFDFWFSGEKMNTKMLALVRQLKSCGFKLFILSNNFKERSAYYRKQFPNLINLFDKIYYSWQTGFIKPSRAAWNLLLKEQELTPRECLYFDDQKQNVELAKSLRVNARLYKNFATTKSIITSRYGYFVIIRGPLGCGKTTVTKKLVQRLLAKYISIDAFLEKYRLDKVKTGAKCIPLKNFIQANKLLLSGVKKELEKGRVVIFDGCFYHKKQIEHLIKNLPYPHYIFTLHAPLKVCIERDKRRAKTLGEDSVRAVRRLVARFNAGHLIDTTKSPDKVIKKILPYLLKNE